MKRYLLLAFILSILHGCASSGNRIPVEKIGMIKEGQTTKTQVIELLGGPTSATITSDGKEILMYYAIKVSSSPQNFIPFVGLIQTRMDTDTQITNILLSKDGIVEKVTSTESKGAIKSGIITD